jgi:hypothetical protein
MPYQLADLFKTVVARNSIVSQMWRIGSLWLLGISLGLLLSTSHAGYSSPSNGARSGDAQTEMAGKVTTVESRSITVRIDRPFDKVYEFLVNPSPSLRIRAGELSRSHIQSGFAWGCIA